MKIAVITSRYPSDNSPYNHMFVHVRVLEIQKTYPLLSVYVPSSDKSTYSYEGVKVEKCYSSSIIEKIKDKDIIYLHLLNIYPFSKSDGWPIYKYIQKNNISFAMYIHGSEVQKYTTRLFEFNYTVIEALKWIKKDVLVIPKMKRFIKATKDRQHSVFICPSLWMKNSLEENLKIKLTKYYIIPNGIDTDFFEYRGLSEKRFNILTIRSLSQKVYNIEQTIDVVNLLPEKYTLVIYGEGVFKNKYENKINELGLQNRIKIVSSFVNKTEMKKIFENYGIFISTTRMDSQGITMMEAMASGLLVASTNNSSKEEFITHLEDGVLGNNANDIAKGILEITENLDSFKTITLAGRKRIENINIEKTMAQELNALESLI